jgi:hypothetical protein
MRLELRPASLRCRGVVAGALFFLLVIFLALIPQRATASPAETCIQQNESCTSWDPSSGPAGTVVHIRGWNWSSSSAGNTSQIAWGFAPDKVVGTITISGDGTFSETIKVPHSAPVGETTIDVDGDFTLGRPLDFTVTQSSAASAELDGPSFVYPKNGQTLDSEGAYLFKVKPVAGASGYLWGFFQGGTMVWENYRYERKLSGTEYAIRPGTPAHRKFVKGKVAVWVRGLVNGKWTKATIITIYLRPKVTPPHTNAPATPTPGPKPQDIYVALGDSFSSGEGAVFNKNGVKIADYESGTDYNTPRTKNACHRTTEAYSYKVQQQLSAKVGRLELKACSGATVKDYFHANNHSAHDPTEPAQKNAITKDNKNNNIKLVTLTFGGNDIGFATILVRCLLWNPFSHIFDCSGQLEHTKTQVPTIGLFDLYSKLLDDAPQARIMVVGYPRLYDKHPKPIPDPNHRHRLGWCTTTAGFAHVHTVDEQKKANDLVNTLNKYIDDTVTKVNKEKNTDRLVYVNVSNAFEGQGICATDDNRLVNLFVKQYNGARSPQQSFHPNSEGQTVLANRVVACYKDSYQCDPEKKKK